MQAVLASLSPLTRLVPSPTPRHFSCRLNRVRCLGGRQPAPFDGSVGLVHVLGFRFRAPCCGTSPVGGSSRLFPCILRCGLREERPLADVHGREAADLQIEHGRRENEGVNTNEKKTNKWV